MDIFYKSLSVPFSTLRVNIEKVLLIIKLSVV